MWASEEWPVTRMVAWVGMSLALGYLAHAGLGLLMEIRRDALLPGTVYCKEK